MNRLHFFVAPSRRRILAAFLWTVAFASISSQDARGAEITRIEEDWSVEFGTPDPDTNAPQVVMTLSPTGDLSGPHAVYEINHRTMPDYAAGGMQLQRWDGEDIVSYKTFHDPSVLAVDNDTFKFTMALKSSNNQLRFSVKNGNSQTWDDFGSTDELKLYAWNDQDGLSGYDSNASLTHSRVGFASHRVKKVIRTQVRYYSGSTLVSTDSNQHVIHQYGEGN